MLSVENLTKSYGDQILFEGVNFKINPRERVGMVGRNGHGKTSLFRMITGREDIDMGSISMPKNYRIGHVRQLLEFTAPSVLKECMTGLSANEKDHFWKAEKILAGLGFSPTDMHRPPGEFSGGYQVRLNLAKILVSDPDLLLLDEPTNYLDIASIRWIVRFLNDWPHELILITHDRSFMDQVVTHIMGIHRRKIKKMPGNTGKFYAQIAQEEEIYEKTRLKDEKRRKEIEQFITRFRAKARLANLVQSRIKTLEKKTQKEKLEALSALDFSFRGKSFPGKQVLRADAVNFSYDPNQVLIEDFDMTVKAGDRICIIGKNGKGKTTLLKLLAGKLQPQKGRLAPNPNTTHGFFEQTNIQSLVDTRTVEEEILYTDPDIDRKRARHICGAMMFSGGDALKKISVLSGGEKSRVMLGKILATPVNLLLLDEPSNHLDMEACDSLLAAVDNFEGTVIMVTHNEMFLHALAGRLIIFQNNGVHVFEGTYQDFLDKVGWEDESIQQKTTSEKADPATIPSRPTKKQIKKKRTQFFAERSDILKPMEKKIQQLEDGIDVYENRLAQLNEAMITASQSGDSEKIAALSRDIHECQSEIDASFGEFETATRSFEEQQAVFKIKYEKLKRQNLI